MDDSNITMEEYIRLEEEKAHKRGKVYNWETPKYGKILYDEDVHDVRSVETKFPAIVFDDAFTSKVTPFYEPTVSPLNDNKIHFRISFDESDDEDYMVIYDENSFSYKIISVNDLKTDLENANDKVNMPLFPSPEPTVNFSNDLDFFKDFEKEFLAIVYNDALTSKSDFLTEPIVADKVFCIVFRATALLLHYHYLIIMPPRRAPVARRAPVPRRAPSARTANNPARNASTTTYAPMSVAAINQLIETRVAKALAN
ncbi:hypothetical protein Tco_0886466 [Tanacetum coccineum]